MNSVNKAIFLGRDGVINEEAAGHVTHWNEFFLFSEAFGRCTSSMKTAMA